MIEKIKENIHNPGELEKLYRSDKKSFESAFFKLLPELEKSDMAEFWRIRLEPEKPVATVSSLSGSEILVVIAICLLCGFLIKIPVIFKTGSTVFSFYARNAAIIIFAGLTLYSFSYNGIREWRKLTIAGVLFLVPLLYANLLPDLPDNRTLNLLYLHLPLLMWFIYGLVYTGFDIRAPGSRTGFIRHNGDLAIMLSMIFIAGGILTVITIGLFNAININIQSIYRDYIVIIGVVSAPLVATFILRNYPTLTSRIAGIIASIFSPIVLITLLIYLLVIAISGKNPYNDRDFLLIFNIMLLGVMALIIFAVSETYIIRRQRLNEIILFMLSIVSIVIDLIALSAIFYRLGQFGVSPNRIAVLGSNILIFCNLLLIMMDLYKVNFRKSDISNVGITISKYLPVYLAWIIIVVFGFPLIFGLH